MRTSCEGKSKITLIGDLLKLISYEVKLNVSELLTWETPYSVFFFKSKNFYAQSTHNITG
jgi:hypothetical protein